MKITLKPINNYILDSIYSHPSIYFTSADIYEAEDDRYRSEDEITYLILKFTKWYIDSALYKGSVFDIQLDGILSYNGCDIFQTLKDQFVNKDNDNEILSILKRIKNLDHDLYIEDIYIDRIDTSCIFIEITSLSNKVSDMSNLDKDNIDLDDVIFADKINKELLNYLDKIKKK